MNLRFVFKLVGRVELMVAASLLLPLAVALFYGESPWPFVLTMGLILCICAPWPGCLPGRCFSRERAL